MIEQFRSRGLGVLLCFVVTFMCMLHVSCCVDDVTGWGGVGCWHSCTYVTLLLIRGGLGWGGILTFTYMPRCWCYVDYLVGRGGMLTFIYILTIHRSSQPWTICFMARNRFLENGKKGLRSTMRTYKANSTQRPSKPPGASQRRSQCIFFRFVYSSF